MIATCEYSVDLFVADVRQQGELCFGHCLTQSQLTILAQPTHIDVTLRADDDAVVLPSHHIVHLDVSVNQVLDELWLEVVQCVLVSQLTM